MLKSENRISTIREVTTTSVASVTNEQTNKRTNERTRLITIPPGGRRYCEDTVSYSSNISSNSALAITSTNEH